MALSMSLGLGCAEEGTIYPTGPADVPNGRPHRVALVSGDAQVGNPGKLLRNMLTVHVSDASGVGVPVVHVLWSIDSGAGSLYPLGSAGRVRSSWTDADGLAHVWFTPSTLGASTMTASAEGLEGSPVTFTAQAEPPVFDSALFFAHAEYLDPAGATGSGGPARYVLYEDSTFVLQYFQTDHWYLGTYSVADSAITLDFNYDSRWQAIAERHGDSLIVRYNSMMGLYDFWDALFLEFEPELVGPIAVSGSPRVYERTRPEQSRYVIRGDGTFALHSAANGQYPGYEYVGTFVTSGTRITFDFAADPRWEAGGEINEDALVVKYNLIMYLSGFVDGTYTRSGG